MTTTLITGANKGLGFETARQLAAAGHTVWVGSRDPVRGQAAADRTGARFVQLDVNDDASVTAAAETLDELDVLVNNAGIAPEMTSAGLVDAAGLDADLLTHTLATNVVGVVRVLRAFLPLLQRSPAPVVVNVSSALGSIARVSDPDSRQYHYQGVAYPVSKAALNMITVLYAKQFPDIRINAVEPGFTATDLNQGTGRQTVEQGAAVIVRLACIDADGPTGGSFGADGPLPW